jgi:hypothetical protein
MTTDIPDDDDFGSSYLVSDETFDSEEVVTERNFLGIAIEHTDLDLYRILTFEYPILIDTFGETVISDNGVSILDYSQRNFEQIANGEQVLVENTFSVSNTASESQRIDWGISYARTQNIGLSIPINGVEVGASLSSNLEGYIDSSYEYNNQYTTSTVKSYSVDISNTPSSSYYQNGDLLYLEWGTRSVYVLKVTIILELNYSLSEYTTGSWFSKVYHYDYSLSSDVGYNTLYKDFELLSTYSRYSNPFIYTFDSINHSYELIDLHREPNRLYFG